MNKISGVVILGLVIMFILVSAIPTIIPQENKEHVSSKTSDFVTDIDLEESIEGCNPKEINICEN